MTSLSNRQMSAWAAPWCAVLLLASCSDDPSPTAPPPVAPPESPDRPALEALYNATGGANWRDRSNWLTATDIGTWHGVEADAAGYVTELSLPNNNLTGVIPAQLGDLSRLRRLLLYGNELSGTIPPELGKLSTVTRISLSSNNLAGPLPAELGALARLDAPSSRCLFRETTSPGRFRQSWGDSPPWRLYLYQNQLSGEIPSQLASLSRLELLRIEDNELSGAIPPDVVRLPELTNLWLSGNALTGGLPPEIGEAVSMRNLLLSGNPELRGLLPRSLLALDYLRVLDYDDTGLCAQIDDKFQEWLEGVPGGERAECDIGEVEQLVLAHLHELTGGASWTNQGGWVSDVPVDEWFGVTADAGRVVKISLPANGLQGPLPGEITNLGELTAIDLDGKDLMGDLPASMKVIDHRRELATDQARALLAAAGPQSDMLVLWGGVVGGELRIEPVFALRTAAQLPDAPGPYRIRGSDFGGQSEFSLDFTPGEDEFGDKYFLFAIPIESGWEDSLDRITLTGPEGTVTLDRDDPRAVSLVTNQSSGRIRAILRDWEGPPPAPLGNPDDLTVTTTRGLGDAVRLRR